MLCENCKNTLNTVRTMRRKVNEDLHTLGLTYHDFLPVSKIDTILESHGLNQTALWIPSSNGGMRVHDEVGQGLWLSVTAYRMDSGRWEVVAYVN